MPDDLAAANSILSGTRWLPDPEARALSSAIAEEMLVAKGCDAAVLELGYCRALFFAARALTTYKDMFAELEALEMIMARLLASRGTWIDPKMPSLYVSVLAGEAESCMSASRAVALIRTADTVGSTEGSTGNAYVRAAQSCGRLRVGRTLLSFGADACDTAATKEGRAMIIRALDSEVERAVEERPASRIRAALVREAGRAAALLAVDDPTTRGSLLKAGAWIDAELARDQPTTCTSQNMAYSAKCTDIAKKVRQAQIRSLRRVRWICTRVGHRFCEGVCQCEAETKAMKEAGIGTAEDDNASDDESVYFWTADSIKY
jgi:hypothetical protein